MYFLSGTFLASCCRYPSASAFAYTLYDLFRNRFSSKKYKSTSIPYSSHTKRCTCGRQTRGAGSYDFSWGLYGSVDDRLLMIRKFSVFYTWNLQIFILPRIPMHMACFAMETGEGDCVNFMPFQDTWIRVWVCVNVSYMISPRYTPLQYIVLFI